LNELIIDGGLGILVNMIIRNYARSSSILDKLAERPILWQTQYKYQKTEVASMAEFTKFFDAFDSLLAEKRGYIIVNCDCAYTWFSLIMFSRKFSFVF